MKNLVYFFVLLFTQLGFAQTPELFYEDGGDLGPLEIRDGNMYYLERQVGLKKLTIEDPTEADLLVGTAEIFDISYFFWGLDGSQIYFGNVGAWYKAPFDQAQINEASFYLSYTGNLLFDLKTTSYGYVLALSDVGTFFAELSDVDPIEFSGQVGDTNGQSKFIALSEDTFYYSDDSDKMLYGATIDDFYNTNEMLFEFESSISQLETWGDQLYVVTKNDNKITVFNFNQDSPWTPIHTIELNEELYSLENIVIDNGDIYFTDRNQGNIYVIPEEALSIETPLLTKGFLFPNPVDSTINLDGNDISILKIYDTTGKLMGSYSQELLVQNIDLSFLPKGLYLAEISNGAQQTQVVKFLKN